MWNVDEILDKLKTRGYKLTGQRKAIVERLCGRKDHPTAEQLYKELKKDYPTISFATIYSTVQLLEEMGYLQILTIDEKKPILTQRGQLTLTSSAKNAADWKTSRWNRRKWTNSKI